MSRSKGRIRQDYLSVINNTWTVRQCRMLEVTGCGMLKNVKEIFWDLKFLSEVTGCRKTQVSDRTDSTVFLILGAVVAVIVW